jgi:hypothetical protein
MDTWVYFPPCLQHKVLLPRPEKPIRGPPWAVWVRSIAMHGTYRLVTLSQLRMEVSCSSHPFPHAISRMMPNKCRSDNVTTFDVWKRKRFILAIIWPLYRFYNCHWNLFVIKPTRFTNFTNLFCHETLHVLDSSSVHRQEFIHCILSNGICLHRYRFVDRFQVLLESCLQTCMT